MLLSFPSTFMGGSKLHTDLQTQQMVWKFGSKPCEQLLFLLGSKLNALIWQEFRNSNKSVDLTGLQHVSHCEEANGPFCFHRPAPTFKAKCGSKLPKGNYSQSSLSLMLIPYCWNSVSFAAQGLGAHIDVNNPRLSPAQVVSGAIQLQRRMHSQPRASQLKHWMELTLPPKVILICFLHLEGNAMV